MRDVAVEAGVAPMTVSYTYTRPERVASQTRERVLAAARRLGYAGPSPVARSLRRGTTGNLGVILGEHLSYAFDDPQAARFLAGVSKVCVENRLGLVLIPSTGAADDADRVREAAVDGFVIWTTVDGDPVLDAVRESGRPAAIQGGPAAEGITAVSPEDEEAARAIAGRMLERGASPLILSFPFRRDQESVVQRGPDTDVPYPVTRSRLAGFRRAIEDAGGRWRDTPVATVARNSRDEAARLVAQVDTGDRPDIVIAMSDQLAAGALDALGDDVFVSGWDDSELAHALGFSSVQQSLHEQGVACARVALGLGSPSVRPEWSLALR